MNYFPNVEIYISASEDIFFVSKKLFYLLMIYNYRCGIQHDYLILMHILPSANVIFIVNCTSFKLTKIYYVQSQDSKSIDTRIASMHSNSASLFV